jgi:zinc protease
MLRALSCSLPWLVAIWSLPLQAADTGSAPLVAEARPDADTARLPIRRTRLDNGLRVVLSRDTSLPSVAVCVTYDVGSRNELEAERGFAQLLELLMFQGSRNVAAGEHARWIAEHGGRHFASTTRDRTQFIDVLPASALALGLWLEADRMKSLELAAAALERQRGLVRERAERQRLDARALGAAELQALVFGEGAPGGPGQAAPAEPSALRAFQQQFYAPSNAVLSVAGDFELLEALNLVHEYFSGARSVARRPAAGGQLPEQAEPRSRRLEVPSGQPALLLQGWAVPAPRSADHSALELARVILGEGRSSRLEQQLVNEKSLARRARAWLQEQRGPDLFGIEVELADAADPELVARLVLGEVAALGRFGPSALELARAREQLRASFWLRLDGNRARASALADAELFAHDARSLEADLVRYLEVSREDVQRAVARYLGSSQRSDVLVRPRAP